MIISKSSKMRYRKLGHDIYIITRFLEMIDKEKELNPIQYRPPALGDDSFAFGEAYRRWRKVTDDLKPKDAHETTAIV